MSDQPDSVQQDVAVPQAESRDEPPAWFKQFADSIEGRFSKLQNDVGRVRRKVKDEAEGGGMQPEPRQVTSDDLSAALKFGEYRAALSGEAREYLDQVAEKRGYADAVQFAEVIARFGAKSGMPAPKPQGYEAAPPVGSASYPRSLEELKRLKQSKPDEYARLMDPAHPFDPSSLR